MPMPTAIVFQSQAKLSHSGEVQTVVKNTDLSVMTTAYPLMRFASSPHRSDHGAVFFSFFSFLCCWSLSIHLTHFPSLRRILGQEL